jgi:uncharacterized protein (TIGR02596 family)
MTHSPARSRAFSLVELVVVIAVLAILAAFSVPAVTSMLQGSSLTQASQMLVDQMNLARQFALSKNSTVGVRFYRYSDPDTPGEDVTKPEKGRFRALQVFEVLSSGAALPLGKVEEMPLSVMIGSDPENPEESVSTIIDRKLSAIVTADEVRNDKSAVELPRGIKKQYDYVSFRFLPDGSTTLGPASQWYITLHGSNDKPEKVDGKQRPPANFFTLQIDPVSGTTKIYRPMAG